MEAVTCRAQVTRCAGRGEGSQALMKERSGLHLPATYSVALGKLLNHWQVSLQSCQPVYTSELQKPNEGKHKGALGEWWLHLLSTPKHVSLPCFPLAQGLNFCNSNGGEYFNSIS